ncbi:response regulator [Natrarchaeobaculum aegyptiacum]|uniref:Response regulator n=1 Tax=Natrarchaeobaculum aegyptiacum TaxID=745377 RepID=A0A2Z2HRA9_9EURY|nr:response regulator [Natrarchaeobaculum aegyptiacum]ARS89293.1 response regulator [Natrarchaeobaculum aegyptiacum]
MAPDDEQEGTRANILLIEPNPGDTRLFTESFTEAKLKNTLYTISNGTDALDFVHQRGEHADQPRPDLILLELKLPGTDGMDVLAELNDEPALREIPVVVLLSSELGKDVVESQGLEADHYVQKPVEPEDFLEFVLEIEGLWFAIVQNSPQDD